MRNARRLAVLASVAVCACWVFAAADRKVEDRNSKSLGTEKELVQGSSASKGAAEVYPTTGAGAFAFLKDAEARLFELGLRASRAAWVQQNFITA
jgi:hypothetical protein